jgi:hypothetical protein
LCVIWLIVASELNPLWLGSIAVSTPATFGSKILRFESRVRSTAVD